MKKIGILALVLVVALSAIGMGYAWWTQTLTINGTVNTGSLKVGFAAGDYTGPDETYAQTEVTNTGTEIFTGYYDAVTASISNAYPGYASGATINIKNAGTIPCKITNVVFNNTSTDFDLDNIIIDTWTFTPSTGSPVSGTDLASLVAAEGTNLANGATATLNVTFHINEDLTDEQDANGSFDITITVGQFNAP